MRDNKIGLLNNAELVLYRNHHSSHAQFFQSAPRVLDQNEIFSFPVRVLTVVGLSLGLWMTVGLVVSAIL